MAKRKRLTPARPAYLDDAARAPETKSMFSPSVGAGAAPIAQVAGDASAVAALEEVSEVLRSARTEGRLVQNLPLDAIDPAYLVRDRLQVDDAEMKVLMDSLLARGQQTPIEVVALDQGLFGLISGWRRLTALQRLYKQTGEDRFAQVQALLREPDDSAAAYLAMVEENEIRVGLSYYERAQVVVRAAQKAVFDSEQAALRGLFASASRAKRSKIGRFMVLFHKLDDRLDFPSSIPERLGLALAKALDADADLAARLRERLRKGNAQSAEEELAILTRATGVKLPRADAKQKPPEQKPQMPKGAEEPVVGVWLQSKGGFLKPSLTLSGPKVDQAFRARLLDWLKTQS